MLSPPLPAAPAALAQVALLPGRVTGATAARFWRTLPARSSVLTDNDSAHRTETWKRAIQSRRARVKTVPPRSGDCAPIEQATREERKEERMEEKGEERGKEERGAGKVEKRKGTVERRRKRKKNRGTRNGERERRKGKGKAGKKRRKRGKRKGEWGNAKTGKEK